MGDAQHLMMSREAAEFVADDGAEPATNIRVDFIEDQDGDAIALSENSLEREHDAGEFPAAGDFAKRLRGLTGVGLGDEFDLIEAR
jgi:hypothetical protein